MSTTRQPCRTHPSLPLVTLVALTALVTFQLSACGGDSGGGAESVPLAPLPPPVAQPVLNTLNAAGSTASLEARTSMAPTDGAGAASVFDDFQPAAAVTIGSVKWQGIYCVQAAGAAAPAATASEFVLSIHADMAGRPDTSSALLQTRFTPAQAAQTLERQTNGLSCGTAANTGWSLYDYSATLPTPFVAVAGTRYWVRVQAVSPSYAVYWGWRAGTTANAQSLLLFAGNYETLTLDRALQLAP